MISRPGHLVFRIWERRTKLPPFPKEKCNWSFCSDISMLNFREMRLEVQTPTEGFLALFAPFGKGFWICCPVRQISSCLCLNHLVLSLGASTDTGAEAPSPGRLLQGSWHISWLRGQGPCSQLDPHLRVCSLKLVSTAGWSIGEDITAILIFPVKDFHRYPLKLPLGNSQ